MDQPLDPVVALRDRRRQVTRDVMAGILGEVALVEDAKVDHPVPALGPHALLAADEPGLRLDGAERGPHRPGHADRLARTNL
jgi:hypothetical protein